MVSEELKGKIRYGDYVVVAEMLGCYPGLAKMRVRRGDRLATEALQLLIENREKLTKDFRSRNNTIYK